LDYHQHQGTRDISAFLTAPKVIQFLKENNWTAKSADSKRLILENYQRFCDLVGSQPICSISSEVLGQMCSIPIQSNNPVALKEMLYNEYKIEIPIMKIDHGTFIRISLNAYNSAEDLEILNHALSRIIRNSNLLE
jgi:isopenicillin-N epimerase